MKQPWKKPIVFALAIPLMVISCSPAPTASPVPPPLTGQIKSPEEVLKAVAEAVNRKDVDAATALLADDVTQTLIPCRLAYNVPQTLLPAPICTESFRGKETMRERFFKEVVALNAYHKFGKCDTSGDKVTCAVTYSDDSTKPLGFDLEMKAEAVVQNGLLKTVTWTLSDQSLAKMQAAMAPQSPPTVEPEVLATQIEDVAGFWLVEWAGTKFGMEFTMEGTYNLWATDIGGAPLSENKIWFEGKQFKVQSNSQSCTTSQGLRNCLGTYQAYVTKQGGNPVGLKLVPVQDDDTNRLAMLSTRVLPMILISAPIVTVTFADGKCAYDGPKQIPAGMFIMVWSVEDQGYSTPGLVIVTLDAGKTIEDLKAWGSSAQPPWVTLVRTFMNVPGRRIKVISSVTNGPFFFVCFSSTTKVIGPLGPIEVIK